MMPRNDPQVTILRPTIATFAAAIGCADAITVLPFTAARGLPDGFARRIARNTQLVLIEEAGIARIADPSAGTGWSEALTGELCRAAWALFQEIERTGGIAAALEQGLIQRRVAAARAGQSLRGLRHAARLPVRHGDGLCPGGRRHRTHTEGRGRAHTLSHRAARRARGAVARGGHRHVHPRRLRRARDSAIKP